MEAKHSKNYYFSKCTLYEKKILTYDEHCTFISRIVSLKEKMLYSNGELNEDIVLIEEMVKFKWERKRF